jgi:VCBS repeat protein
MNILLLILTILEALCAGCGPEPQTARQTALLAPAKSSRIAAGDGPGSVAIADLNSDGKADLLVANQQSADVTVLLGDGRGGFLQAKGSPFQAGPHPNDLAVFDVNRDGKLDIAIPNHETKNVTVLLGDGRGGFAPAPGSPITVKTNPHPHTIAGGDLNRDGKLDLIIDDWQNNNLTLLFGKGDGSFDAPGVSVPVPPVPYENICTSDVNGDGKLDIITPAQRHNAITVLLGDGRGGFKQAAGSPFPCGKDPFFVSTGDFNGDRKADIAVATYSGSIRQPGSDGLTVLLGDGSGAFKIAEGSPFQTGKAPVRLATGDINRDGQLDIAVVNLGSDDVTVLLGGETIRAAPGSPFAAGRQPYAAAIGDLNGDDRPDLVTANYKSNDLTILFGN